MSKQGENNFGFSSQPCQPPIQPRYVFLFSGHMIDAPGRKIPRFPAYKENRAAAAVGATLNKLEAGPADIGLCGGACGGDLLFAEACLARGLHVEIRIPFAEPTFLKKSVIFAGEAWLYRYNTVKNNPLTSFFIMPQVLGPTPEKVNPYERNNLWLLNTALSLGPDKVRFICLWNGNGGDGPGGTKHMHDEVLKHSGKVFVIDTKTL
ncbi:MAG: hypothetical protein ABFD75_07620 [Smithella sp.]